MQFGPLAVIFVLVLTALVAGTREGGYSRGFYRSSATTRGKAKSRSPLRSWGNGETGNAGGQNMGLSTGTTHFGEKSAHSSDYSSGVSRTSGFETKALVKDTMDGRNAERFDSNSIGAGGNKNVRGSSKYFGGVGIGTRGRNRMLSSSGSYGGKGSPSSDSIGRISRSSGYGMSSENSALVKDTKDARNSEGIYLSSVGTGGNKNVGGSSKDFGGVGIGTSGRNHMLSSGSYGGKDSPSSDSTSRISRTYGYGMSNDCDEITPLAMLRKTLLFGAFRTYDETEDISEENIRNRLIEILEKHSSLNQSQLRAKELTRKADSLEGMAAINIFLRDMKIRTVEQLKSMSDTDQRNTLIGELNHRFGIPASKLQPMGDVELVFLGVSRSLECNQTP